MTRDADDPPEPKARGIGVDEPLHLMRVRLDAAGRNGGKFCEHFVGVLLEAREEYRTPTREGVADHLPQERRLAGAWEPRPDGDATRVDAQELAVRVERRRRVLRAPRLALSEERLAIELLEIDEHRARLDGELRSTLRDQHLPDATRAVRIDAGNGLITHRAHRCTASRTAAMRPAASRARRASSAARARPSARSEAQIATTADSCAKHCKASNAENGARIGLRP